MRTEDDCISVSPWQIRYSASGPACADNMNYRAAERLRNTTTAFWALYEWKYQSGI